jgi:3-phytase
VGVDMRRQLPLAIACALVLVSMPMAWAAATVGSIAEAPPVRGAGDIADDPAIWVHPKDPSRSLVIGSNKGPGGGLHVYDLQANELQFIRLGRTNNVHVRDLDAQTILVAATNRSTNSIDLLRLDPVARRLTKVGSIRASTPAIYGLCMYESARTGSVYVFATFESGAVKQYKVHSSGTGGTLVRSFDAGGRSEGCVGDGAHGHLYLGVEEAGVFRYGAEPSSGDARTTVDLVGAGRLVADVEGIALYRGNPGYLVVSSQGDSTIALYTRQGDNSYVGSFTVRGSGGVDMVNRTDGLDVKSVPLSPAFPRGLLVVHDSFNSGGDASNYKYVSWKRVEVALGLSPLP